MRLLDKIKQAISPRPRLGVQVIGKLSDLDHLVSGSLAEIRLLWKDVEQQPGVYTWPAELIAWISVIRAKKCPLILSIKHAPDWARLYPEWVCSAPSRICFDDFAQFALRAAVLYKPFAVEVWNEPDVDRESCAPDWAHYGCFGADADAGRYYGQMYQQVYKLVKRYYPGVTILAGALMHSVEFCRGMVATAGRMDAVSYHAYAGASYRNRIFENATVYRQAGVKAPLWCTETSLLADEDSVEHERNQADYLRSIMTDRRLKTYGIQAVLWYPLVNQGWRNSGLVRGGRRTLAWDVYRQYCEGKL